MKIVINLLALLISISAFSQSSKPPSHEIMKVTDGLYHLFYDSSTAKSTIVEFDKYVALVEVPVKNLGGGATQLKDHVFGGNKVLAAIEKYFPDKPLKYVLHSHWHPHSISSLKPFLDKGITLVSTRSNFAKLASVLDKGSLDKYMKHVRFVDGDSLVIRDRSNSIVAYRFRQQEYKSTPSEDYLYFYYPKYYAFHAGCMYNKWTGAPVDGREVLTDREQDLNNFVKKRKLDVKHFVRISGDRHLDSCMIDASEFENTVKTGITATEINSKYLSMPTSALVLMQDSIVEKLLEKNIPLSLVNTNVYNALREKDFDRALALAKLQVMANPGDANAWDTLGEVTFVLGRKDLAMNFHKQSVKLDPLFTAGGIGAWEATLKNYQAIWNKQ